MHFTFYIVKVSSMSEGKRLANKLLDLLLSFGASPGLFLENGKKAVHLRYTKLGTILVITPPSSEPKILN